MSKLKPKVSVIFPVWFPRFKSVTRIPTPDKAKRARARDGTRNDQNDNLSAPPPLLPDVCFDFLTRSLTLRQFVPIVFSFCVTIRTISASATTTTAVNREAVERHTCIEIKINIQDRYS
uniref:(northern house mosquito) hypothetical protein n=1 Tax=Culex pipiens TaxID=7175 RepID=A0A8D8GCD4_CULPI